MKTFMLIKKKLLHSDCVKINFAITDMIDGISTVHDSQTLAGLKHRSRVIVLTILQQP